MLKLFEILPQLHSLEGLNVSSNGLNYYCFDYLASLFRLGKLRLKTIDISNTKIFDK